MPQPQSEPTGVAQRRPGRPRDAALESQVLQTVVDLIDAGITVTVKEVVARSGVSRAAIYRRWSTLDVLISDALDVSREVVYPPDEMTAREAILSAYPGPDRPVLESYPESRVRQRLLLALADPDLQHEYWNRHVSQRRVPLLAFLQRAQDRGEVRAGVDLDATLDLLSGVFYYQLVARGAELTDPETMLRCRAAVDIIWNGIAPLK
ncbi:AcrR family transcriptional regulator [Leucobacter exalbidus]|uniref:AcrR family transcriptional regulator n=1 Tax=Leucobacter exalbidus TaxID=662960 RepID=A0A940T283_9MICO|nr:TetR/AcrR family transcriptional regulator C-terminal ligand-binding domain-containing protein [Leucobacter exalbidus]MBP1327585.1 AcrR family transcriptional regulator [Leucobacter exalbidus]